MLAANTNSYFHGTVMPEIKTKILVCNAGSGSLKDNSLLQELLKLEHPKPRLSTTCWWTTSCAS
jgi:hypothetical protein